ncbi:hypothetical protein RHMOL_Rhmol08G0285600 [Rhododendron molle]|uniref:Uncharacterized protein n=1 Tax=Rhododendron molle TaxID=49168 RepID=A0ACC0MTR5_RHOML|nr:hypothetical protein RHMOL_Rhmol08G0285600 [Rhododendron molle]
MVVVFRVIAAVMLQCAVTQMTYVLVLIGWTIPQNGAEAYMSWASDRTFVIGDVLRARGPREDGEGGGRGKVEISAMIRKVEGNSDGGSHRKDLFLSILRPKAPPSPST